MHIGLRKYRMLRQGCIFNGRSEGIIVKSRLPLMIALRLSTWYKNCLIKVAKSLCGKTKEVNKSVRDKKTSFQILNHMMIFRLVCQKTKQCISETKSKSQQDFGHYVKDNFYNGPTPTPIFYVLFVENCQEDCDSVLNGQLLLTRGCNGQVE